MLPTPDGRERRLYGSCRDAQAFYQDVYSRLDERSCFVIIRGQCSLFLDLEWYSQNGPDDTRPQRLEALAEAVRLGLGPTAPEVAPMHICDFSRDVGGGWFKNSFHVAFPQLVFRSTHDAGAWVKLHLANANNPAVAQLHIDTSLPQYQLHKNTGCIIDPAVYSRNRCWRLPGSHKLQDSTRYPLPSFEHLVTQCPPFAPRAPGWLLVSVPPSGGPRCDRANPPPVVVARTQDLVCPKLLQMLSGWGDSTSTVTVERDKKTGFPFYVVRSPRGRGRPCLVDAVCRRVAAGGDSVTTGVNRRLFHTSNNAYMFLGGKGAVFYGCHGGSCKVAHPNVRSVFLGNLLEPTRSQAPVAAIEEETAVAADARAATADEPEFDDAAAPHNTAHTAREFTEAERRTLQQNLLPYLRTARFGLLQEWLQENDWPASCWQRLKHDTVAGVPCPDCPNHNSRRQIVRDAHAWWLAVCGRCQERAAQPKKKKRRTNLPNLAVEAKAADVAEAELRGSGGYRFLFAHQEYLEYDGGDQRYPDEEIKDEAVYNERWMRNVVVGEGIRLCFVRAAMGLRKSEMLLRLLLAVHGQNTNNTFTAAELASLAHLRGTSDSFRVLVIGPRISFDSQMHQRLLARLKQSGLQIVFYQDVNRDAQFDKATFQYESVHHLLGQPPFDLVVLDESESTLFNVTAGLCQGDLNQRNATVFARLLRTSKCVLAMDAFLSAKTVRVLQEILAADTPRLATEASTRFVRNTHTEHMQRRAFVHRSTKSLKRTLIRALCRGRNVVIALGNKRQGERLKLQLEERFPGIRVLFYHQGSERLSDFQEANDALTAEWQRVHVLMYTSVLTVGVDFSPRHFDCLFSFINNTGIPMLYYMQMAGRARFLRCREWHLGVGRAKANGRPIHGLADIRKRLDCEEAHTVEVERAYGVDSTCSPPVPVEVNGKMQWRKADTWVAQTASYNTLALACSAQQTLRELMWFLRQMGQDICQVDYSHLRPPPKSQRHDFLLGRVPDDLTESEKQQLKKQHEVAKIEQQELKLQRKATAEERLELRRQVELQLDCAADAQSEIAPEAARLARGSRTQEEQQLAERDPELSRLVYADKTLLYTFAANFPNLRPDWASARAADSDFQRRYLWLKLLRDQSLEQVYTQEHKPGTFVALYDQRKVLLPALAAFRDCLAALRLSLAKQSPALQLSTLDLDLPAVTQALRKLRASSSLVTEVWRPTFYIASVLDAPDTVLPAQHATACSQQVIQALLPCTLERVRNAARSDGQFNLHGRTYSRYELLPNTLQEKSAFEIADACALEPQPPSGDYTTSSADSGL
eukprot:g74886.t1